MCVMIQLVNGKWTNVNGRALFEMLVEMYALNAEGCVLEGSTSPLHHNPLYCGEP